MKGYHTMSIVKETLRQLIAFSQQQMATKQRQLTKDGKPQENVTVDAYATIIKNLSDILGDEKSKNDEQPDEPS